MCTAHSKGREHDFKLFKRSCSRLLSTIKCLGDKGYQGISKIHRYSKTPHKKPRGEQLNKQQRLENSQLASVRIVVEHVYRHLKIFRILSERYRNRGKRFGLRFNLISGIYNYELCFNYN